MKKLLILLTAILAMSMTAKAQDWLGDHARVKAVSDFLKKFRLVSQETPKYAVTNYPITYYDVYAITGTWTNTRNEAINDVVMLSVTKQIDMAKQASQLYVVNRQNKMKFNLATDTQLNKAINHRFNIQSELGPYNHTTKGFYLSMLADSYKNLQQFQKKLEKILQNSRQRGGQTDAATLNPPMPPKVTGRSSDGSGLIIKTNNNPDNVIRQFDNVRGMQILVTNNKTQQQHTFLVKANDWKENIKISFSDLGITDPDDIDITLCSRWYYLSSNASFAYSECSSKENYKDKRGNGQRRDRNTDSGGSGGGSRTGSGGSTGSGTTSNEDNIINVTSVNIGVSITKNYWEEKISNWNTFDHGDFNEEGLPFTSVREGDYQVITARYNLADFDKDYPNACDMSITLTIKIDKNYNATGSFSIHRKSHAQAGRGYTDPENFTTCNMSMSATFGPQQAEVWHGIKLLRYVMTPKSLSFQTGPFNAYYVPLPGQNAQLRSYQYSSSSPSLVNVAIDVYTSSNI